MTDLIGELRRRRLVRELEPVRRPGAGRPTRPIAFDGEPWCVLGVHLAVDAVHFVASTVGGHELWSETVPAELRHSGPQAGPAIVEKLLHAQLERIPADKQLVAVEFGVPGYVARDRGTVGWSAAFDWSDLPLRELISESLGAAGEFNIHVGISTDCHLAALHATRVELDLPPDVIATYFGGVRNVGSGVVIAGEIFRGANGGAGDFGHRNVDPSGPPCWCGRRGCLESLVGPKRLLVTTGLLSAAEAERLVDDQPEKAVRLLADAAAAGDQPVLDALDAAGNALGGVMDDMIGLINPHAVILGDYLGVIGYRLLPAIHRQIAARVSNPAFAATTVLPLEETLPRVARGAMLAARDACLYDPLALTTQLESA